MWKIEIQKNREDYFYAQFERNPKEVNGCPLGRGATPLKAFNDLIYRLSYETPNVTVSKDNCEFVYTDWTEGNRILRQPYSLF